MQSNRIAQPPPSQEQLRCLFDYQQDTGEFYWRVAIGNVAAGSVAGKTNHNGYRLIGLRGRHYLAHRLAWLYVYGELPANQIDHINGVRHDNRIANLRAVTRSENMQNQCGVRGYSWNKKTRKWKAYIVLNGKQKHLGLFDAAQDARLAYLSAKAIYHPTSPIKNYLIRCD